MLRYAFVQMRSSLGRLAAAAVAIILGTAFVAATLLSAQVLRATAEATVTADLGGADVVASGHVTQEDADAAAALPGVRSADVRLRVSGILDAGGSTRWAELESLPEQGRAPELTSGRLPQAVDEVALSAELADALDVSTDDTLQWRTPDGEGDLIELTVTGIALQRPVLFSDAPVWATAASVAALREAGGMFATENDTLLVRAAEGSSADEVAADVQGIVSKDSFVQTAREVIDQEVADLLGDADFFIAFGMAFAAVAIVVAGMVIANTFEVLVAQRTRSLTLLRCAGATSGQVAGAVLVEAALLGVISSLAGAFLGLGLGRGAAWLLSRQDLGIELPQITDFDPGVLLIPLAVGVVVTVAAAIGPARAATRVSPVAAMRPVVVVPSSKGGAVRLVLGLALALIGLGLLTAGLMLALAPRWDDSLDPGGVGLSLVAGIAGGLAIVAGFLVLAVFLVPPVVRAIGGVLKRVLPRRARASIELATANAVRNPQRTSATTSALVIGVALIAMFGTGAATARTTMDAELNQQFPTDAVVFATTEEGLSPEVIEGALGTEGIVGGASAWVDFLHLEDDAMPVLVADPAELGAIMPGEVRADAGVLAVSPRGYKVLDEADEVALYTYGEPSAADGATLPVEVVDGLPVGALLSPATARNWIGDSAPTAVLLDLDEEGSSRIVTEVQRAVSEADPDSPASVTAPIETRQAFDRAITAMLGILLGLVGVAVIIALVGIANTLSLSVIERRREHGVLQAVGVTRPQLRGMLAIEGALIAVAGALIGAVIGTGLGIAGATMLLARASAFTPDVNWWILLGCFGVALVAGVIASVLPSRSATRVPVVVALAAE